MPSIKNCSLLLLVVCCFNSRKAYAQREHLSMDPDWRFAFGHPYDPQKDFNHATGYFSYLTKTGYGDGPAAKKFNDRTWRKINLPHDWAVEMPFSSRAGYSHGYKTIGRNFPETSVGWYRKTFSIPASDLGRRISIEFDGVHRNSTVFINGFYVGEEHSGYYNFQYDLTPYLNYGGDNVIAVRVDVTFEEGWFYEGAGIYRHVWLNKTAPLHISPYGVFVSSELNGGNAQLTARATISNQDTAARDFDITQTVLDANGKSIASATVRQCSLPKGNEKEFFSAIPVNDPKLWSPETPYLYKLITTIKKGDSLVDKLETLFGIRTIHFDANQGFFLNGKHYLIKGTNNHQDHAGVGTAIPDALQDYRIKKLKEMGSNAYRCSHNPPTPELLDACDRLGMLVLEENRLMGINQEHLELLKRMILHDRNHPSVIAWSLGNEEWAIESNILGARIAATMETFAHQLDSTRLNTAAISGGCGNGTSLALDLMGFNYMRQCDIDEYHKKFPWQPSMTTEETTTKQTRGVYETDSINAHMMAADRLPGGYSTEQGYRFFAARPFVSGLFFWTGFDYRGEPEPYGWPQVTSQFGIMDLCGFPKDTYYYLRSQWTNETILHLIPHWNWAGQEGKPISVWAYSNCDEVELFLNKKSLGKKAMPKQGHAEWTVTYKPGVLLARGYKNGKEVITDKVETTGAPAAIRLQADRSSIKADGEDVSVITVKVNDAKGLSVPTAMNEISFSIDGPGRIIGVGNGDPSSHDPDKYIESVSQVKIENLRAMLVETKNNYPETDPDFNDAGWPSPFNEQAVYNLKAKGDLNTMVIRSDFNLPELTANTEIWLWPKALGETEDIYVNGHLITQNIKRFDEEKSFKLDASILHKGVNKYVIVGKPLVERYKYDDLNTDPGIVQVINPSAQWKRKLFNGLAQVIVQSNQQAGTIALKASGAGLLESVISIQSEPALLRPAVAGR